MRRFITTIAITLAALTGAVAGNPALQLINLSPHPALDYVQVELNDSVLVDSLAFNGATAFLDVPDTTGATLTFTSLTDPAIKGELTGIDLTADVRYQAIFYGVHDTFRYTPNPDGQDLSLQVAWTQVDTAGLASGMVRTRFFHAVGDAVELDVADLLYEYIVDDLTFGEYGAQITDLPADLRSLFFVSSDSVTQLASRSADLSLVQGGSVTIFLSGFIVPINNFNGPAIKFYMADADGNVWPLGFILNAEENLLATDLSLYPNPASDFARISLTLDAPARIGLSLIDLAGRNLLDRLENLPAGKSEIHLDLPALPTGFYLVRLTDGNRVQALPIVIR